VHIKESLKFTEYKRGGGAEPASHP